MTLLLHLLHSTITLWDFPGSDVVLLFVVMEGCESQVACCLSFAGTDDAYSELFHLFQDELSIVITCDLM